MKPLPILYDQASSSAHSDDRTLVCFEENDFREGKSDPSALFTELTEKIEQFECKIARVELEAGNYASETDRALCPLKNLQALEAFDLCHSVHHDQIPKNIADAYILASGIKPSANYRIPCAPLLRAIVAHARANKGAAASRRAGPRISTYASAIDFALATRMSREEFLRHLRGERTNGRRQGINHLAEEGRRRRRPRAGLNIRGPIQKAIAALCLQEGDEALLIFKRRGADVDLIRWAKRPSAANS